MAIINKTGIGNGNTIQAEHVTRIIDALSGQSTDTVAATGSFQGTFDGTSATLTSATIDGTLINGQSNTAGGSYSHAEGGATTATGQYSHAEGQSTIALNLASHAEGYSTDANGNYSHAEGYQTLTTGQGAHAEGYQTVASNDYSHAEGNKTLASGRYSLAIGQLTTASADQSFASGYATLASANGAHAAGLWTTASGIYSRAAGEDTDAEAKGSHAEGLYTLTQGNYSHAEGRSTYTYGTSSHAEGWLNSASGDYSHAEGISTWASGFGAHAEGRFTTASGNYSHAEGALTKTYGLYSHAEGSECEALGNYSHAQGLWTVTSASFQHATGHYNTHGDTTSLFIIGDGTSNAARSDVFKAKTDLIEISGSLRILSSGATSATDAVTIRNSSNIDLLAVQNDGNVGIGTITPIASLHVDRYDAVNATGARPTDSWASIIENRRDSGNFHGLSVVTRHGDSDSKIFEAASSWGGASEVYTPAMTVLGNRRVGIGTSTPSSSLHVKGNAGALTLEGNDHTYIAFHPDGYYTSSISGINNNRKGYIGYAANTEDWLTIANEDSDKGVALKTGGYVRQYVAPNGAISFGTSNTTTPSHSVEVQEQFGITPNYGDYTDIVQNMYWDNTVPAGWRSRQGGGGSLIRPRGGNTTGNSGASGSIEFAVTGAPPTAPSGTRLEVTQSLWLDANGNVGIGGGFDNVFIRPTKTLHVNGTARVGSIPYTGNSRQPLYYEDDGYLVANTSDIRFKTNISTLTGSLDKVNNLRGVTFKWINEPTGSAFVGFIAQEVESVIPELVFTDKKGPEQYKGVYYAEMTALLVEAVKTLSAENESLKSELQTIKTHLGL
jgi:hypothetical protein